MPDLDPMDADDRVLVALSFTLARRETQTVLFDYVEVFYNRQWLHSGIGDTRPISRAITPTPTP
jgi:hypothetical protein